MDVTLQDVLDTALSLSFVYVAGIPVLMIVTGLIGVLVQIPLTWMGFPDLPSSSMRHIFFLAMVIYAAPSIALAVLFLGYAPVHLCIALIIFAILQVPIAFYYFGWNPDDFRNDFTTVLLFKSFFQFLAVFTAHFMGVWLEALFFA